MPWKGKYLLYYPVDIISVAIHQHICIKQGKGYSINPSCLWGCCRYIENCMHVLNHGLLWLNQDTWTTRLLAQRFPDLYLTKNIQWNPSCYGKIQISETLILNVRGPIYLGLNRPISWLLMPWLLASWWHVMNYRPRCKKSALAKTNLTYKLYSDCPLHLDVIFIHHIHIVFWC